MKNPANLSRRTIILCLFLTVSVIIVSAIFLQVYVPTHFKQVVVNNDYRKMSPVILVLSSLFAVLMAVVFIRRYKHLLAVLGAAFLIGGFFSDALIMTFFKSATNYIPLLLGKAACLGDISVFAGFGIMVYVIFPFLWNGDNEYRETKAEGNEGAAISEEVLVTPNRFKLLIERCKVASVSLVCV